MATTEPAESRPVRLHVLGSGTAWPTAEHGSPGYLLEWTGGDAVLLDPGPGSLRAAARAGFELPTIRGALFTHYHPDHCLDWVALRFALLHPDRLGQRSLAAGPVGLRDLDRRILGLFGRWVELTPDRQELVELEPGPFRLEFAPKAVLEGVGIAVPHEGASVGYRLQTQRGTLAYSGDTGEHDAVVELGRDADLFVLEAAFPDGADTAKHLTPKVAAELASRAGCRRLVLTHLYPETRGDGPERSVAAHFPGPWEFARDGLRLEL